MKNKRYSNREEWANTLSHGAGILLGIVAGYFLLRKASVAADPRWAVPCVIVYLAGMLSSYISSTWYHGSRPGALKEQLRKFDHGAIYLHIAGTYTPFTLLVLRHAGGQETLYAHLQYCYVRAGEVVQAGQPLGSAGQTGRATGAHLHFALRDGGLWCDPARALELS